MTDRDLVGRLGLDPKRRVAILHADDVGMCHGANASFLELSASGAITCGSVMVPCPWFPEMARAAAASACAEAAPELAGARST